MLLKKIKLMFITLRVGLIAGQTEHGRFICPPRQKAIHQKTVPNSETIEIRRKEIYVQ
jgi:hypothetical protein